MKKIFAAKKVFEGEMYPPFYGIAYVEYYANYAVAYPVPINLIVRFGRWLWHESIRWRPTKLDEMLRKAYRQGREDQLRPSTPAGHTVATCQCEICSIMRAYSTRRYDP